MSRQVRDWLVGSIRRLPRPMALSLRNAFRRKARVALKLLTLACVGVMFIMVMSVRVSLESTVEVALAYWHYDVMIVFSCPYRTAQLAELTESVPGVIQAEVWDLRIAQLSLADGTEFEIQVYVTPSNAEMLQPNIISGRGLLPDDGYAILFDGKLAAEQGIRVGDEIKLIIAVKETAWTVVGLNAILALGNNYVPLNTLARETDNTSQGGIVIVMFEEHDAQAQERLIDALNDVYVVRHVGAKSFMSAHEFRERGQELFDVLSLLMLTMAVLAAVGAALWLVMVVVFSALSSL